MSMHNDNGVWSGDYTRRTWAHPGDGVLTIETRWHQTGPGSFQSRHHITAWEGGPVAHLDGTLIHGRFGWSPEIPVGCVIHFGDMALRVVDVVPVFYGNGREYDVMRADDPRWPLYVMRYRAQPPYWALHSLLWRLAWAVGLVQVDPMFRPGLRWPPRLSEEANDE